MWAQVGGAFLQGLVGGSSQKKAEKRRFKFDWRLQEGAGRISRQNTAYEYELQDYYKQKDRGEKRRGLDEYRKFSTVQQFAPGYQNTTPAPTMPTLPNPAEGIYAPVDP
jgi:hypothetical protein